MPSSDSIITGAQGCEVSDEAHSWSRGQHLLLFQEDHTPVALATCATGAAGLPPGEPGRPRRLGSRPGWNPQLSLESACPRHPPENRIWLRASVSSMESCCPHSRGRSCQSSPLLQIEWTAQCSLPGPENQACLPRAAKLQPSPTEDRAMVKDRAPVPSQEESAGCSTRPWPVQSTGTEHECLGHGEAVATLGTTSPGREEAAGKRPDPVTSLSGDCQF